MSVTKQLGLKRFSVTTFAKRFPKYVHSRTHRGCLVHEVAALELRWRDYSGDSYFDEPLMLAYTQCGKTRRASISVLGNDLATGLLVCLKCQGHQIPTVSKQRDVLGPSGFTWNEAGQRLGRLALHGQVIQ